MEKTDPQGVIRMTEIPIDVYVVEVSETNDYQAESFVIFCLNHHVVTEHVRDEREEPGDVRHHQPVEVGLRHVGDQGAE